jgi:hypothetical protein
MMRKLKAEMPKYDFSMLLNKAVLAHNSLANNLGFTPLQIVTGVNPSLPSALTSSSSTLENAWHL